MQGLVLSRYFDNNFGRLGAISPKNSFEGKLTAININKPLTTNVNPILFHDITSNHLVQSNTAANDTKLRQILTKYTVVDFRGFIKEEKEYSTNKSEMIHTMYEFYQRNLFEDEEDVGLKKYLHNTESKYFSNLVRSCGKLGKLSLSTKGRRKINYISKLTKTHIRNRNEPDTFVHNKVVNQLYTSQSEKINAVYLKANLNKTNIDFEKEYFKNITNSHIIPTRNDINDTKSEKIQWIPPRSPHNLIEEILYHDPWALLVATIFLNKTSCTLARPHIFWFLVENPEPLSVIYRFPKDLEKYFENLGLKKTRAVQIWRMTNEYLQNNWKKPSDLYGIGNYGECAYRMFYLGDFNVEPTDKFLRIYKEWYRKVMLKV